MNNLITLNKITKSFYTNKKIQVLNKINLKLHKGKIYSIVGPSGSGKSTLLNILSMIDKPSSGSLFIGKQNINFIVYKTFHCLQQKIAFKIAVDKTR